MIDDRIRTFLEVCQTMNYTRAADKLHLTQPAVSQHIRWLEKEYDAKLFQMQGKKLLLTRQGELLKEMATAVYVDDLKIHKLIQDSKRQRQTLHVGATLTIGEYLMPEVLERYLLENPDTDISMYVKNTESLLMMLQEGSIDFAVIEGYFDKKSYGYHKISDEKYIGVCGAGCGRRRQALRLEELFEERLIIREEGSGTREIFCRYLREHNYDVNSFKHRLEASNMGAVKAMVMKNMGITFLYERAVEKEIAEGRLFPLKITDFQIQREFYFVYLKDSIFNEKYDTILKYF